MNWNLRENKSLMQTVILAASTFVFTILTCIIDRRAIGPNDTKVGFALINGSFSKAIETHPAWDTFTDILLVIAILAAVSFVVLGVMELIKSKNIFRVDPLILEMAVLYVVVIILYIIFNHVPINYRPVLAEGETELETSYPSTHVLVICTILGSAMVAWSRIRLFKERKQLLEIMKIASVVVICLGIAGRMISGVHWMTDIIAGCLMSATLISAYITFIPAVTTFVHSKRK